MTENNANPDLFRVGQKLVELNESLRELTQEASAAMADNNLNTAPEKVTKGGQMLLCITKALEQINKAYICYEAVATTRA